MSQNKGSSPAAVAATLQMLRQQTLPYAALEAAAEAEAAVQARFFKGHDIREGLRAVQEKRPPVFAEPAVDPDV